MARPWVWHLGDQGHAAGEFPELRAGVGAFLSHVYRNTHHIYIPCHGGSQTSRLVTPHPWQALTQWLGQWTGRHCPLFPHPLAGGYSQAVKGWPAPSPFVRLSEALRLPLRADVTASQDPDPPPLERASGISRPGTFTCCFLLLIYQESEKLAENTLQGE